MLSTSWLNNACEHDYLIIQGEYCATFAIVDWALNHGLISLSAVSKGVEI